MTHARQRIHGALGALTLAAVFAAPIARAEGTTSAPTIPGPVVLPLAPVAAPAAVAPAPTPAPAPAKAAAAGDKAWLRSAPPAKKTPAASAPASASPFRLAFSGIVVLALGGAAVLHRRRRRGVAQTQRSELTVVSRARVGNKADVVVLDVGGRKILLGVTDSEVSRLAWLDGEVEGAEVEPAAAAQSFESRVLSAPAPRALEPLEAAVVEPPRGFRDVLRGAMSRPARATQKDVPQSAALAIAEATEDVVFSRSGNAAARVAAPAGAPDMVDIEGQARGLILRLSKRA